MIYIFLAIAAVKVMIVFIKALADCYNERHFVTWGPLKYENDKIDHTLPYYHCIISDVAPNRPNNSNCDMSDSPTFRHFFFKLVAKQVLLYICLFSCFKADNNTKVTKCTHFLCTIILYLIK